jgi:hypothetical protein
VDPPVVHQDASGWRGCAESGHRDTSLGVPAPLRLPTLRCYESRHGRPGRLRLEPGHEPGARRTPATYRSDRSHTVEEIRSSPRTCRVGRASPLRHPRAPSVRAYSPSRCLASAAYVSSQDRRVHHGQIDPNLIKELVYRVRLWPPGQGTPARRLKEIERGGEIDTVALGSAAWTAYHSMDTQ